MRWLRLTDRKAVLAMIKLFADERESLLQILQEEKSLVPPGNGAVSLVTPLRMLPRSGTG